MRFVVIFALPLMCVSFLARPTDACLAPIVKVDPVSQVSVMLGSSTVVLAYDGRRQTTTLIPEVKSGSTSLRKFAILMPVKGKVSKKSFSVVSDEVHFQLLNHSAPIIERVVDQNPCVDTTDSAPVAGQKTVPMAEKPSGSSNKAAAFGVHVDGHFEVGEYDIALLSAKNAKGLARWLRRFKYTIDAPVEEALGEYLKSGHRLVVARVHLKQLLTDRFTSLRPLRVRTAGKGLPPLPLRIAGAGGATSLTVLTLDKTRANPTAYRMLQLPSNVVLPGFVADDWEKHYSDVKKHWRSAHGGDQPSALLEFAGPAPTLKLATLGAAPGAFMTRWNLEVDASSPDLSFEAGKAELFRTRFVAHVPWYSNADICPDGKKYLWRTKRQLIDEANEWERLSGTPSGSTVQRFKRSYPKAFVKPIKRDPNKLKATVVEQESEGGIAWYWKVAGGLFAAMALLIGIGRIQRG